MKKALILLALTGLGTSLAQAHTPDWKADVLKSLNQICGDTWCEGDYNIIFRKIDCNFNADITFSDKKGACKIMMVMNQHGAAPMSASVESCLLTGFDSIQSLIRGDGNSFDSGISDRLYKDVSNCISALESLK